MRSNLFLILIFGILAISACYAISCPLPSPNSIEKVNGIIDTGGTSIASADGNFVVYLNGINPTTHSALMTIKDSCDTILSMDEVKEGQTLTKALSGADISITVHKTAEPSFTALPPWANVTLSINAITVPISVSPNFYYNDSASPAVFWVYLDDIEAGTNDAIIQILDPFNPPAYHEKIKSGGSITRNISGKYYKITVMQTYPAAVPFYTSTNWMNGRAKIKIEPATSGTNPNNYNFLSWFDLLEYNISGAYTTIRLADIEKETRSAIFFMLDENGTVIANEKVKEGQTIVVVGVGGYLYTIKNIQVAAGGGASSVGYPVGVWAKLNVTAPSSNPLTATSPVTFIYDSASIGSMRVKLVNFERDTRKAMVEIYTTAGPLLLYNETIAEGQTMVRNVSGTKYSIKVAQVATGYSYDVAPFAYKAWAKFILAPALPTAAISPPVINYTAVPLGDYIVNDPFTPTMVAYVYGLAPVSHEASIETLDLMAGPPAFFDSVKAGSSVVRGIVGNRYKISVYQTAPGYYTNGAGVPVLGWAKIGMQNSTAAAAVNYTTIGFMGTPAYCPSGDLVIVFFGLETGTHKPIINVYNSSFGGGLIYQDKLAIGSTKKYNFPGFANCTVKVVQTFDDYTYFPAGAWAKLVVS
ncbi:MAG: hypothetical protein V1492_01345 [Candidatus Micrarchaeota archaeon]